MTQKECLDAVKSRADQTQTALNLDDKFILTFMNHTIREVNTFAFSANQDFFVVQGVNIIATPVLPIGILNGMPIRVNCTNPDDAVVHDARDPATPNEAWKVMASSRNPGLNADPLYFIGDHATNYRTLKILPTTIVTATADLWILPDDLAIDGTAAATVIPVPAGWEVAVIYGTYFECLNKITALQQLQPAQQAYLDTINKLGAMNKFNEAANRTNIQAMPPVRGQQ